MFVVWKKGEITFSPSEIYVLNIDDGICWSTHYGRCPKKGGWVFASTKITEAIKNCLLQEKAIIFLTKYETVYSATLEILNSFPDVSNQICVVLSDMNEDSIRKKIIEEKDILKCNLNPNIKFIFVQNMEIASITTLTSNMFLERFCKNPSSGVIKQICDLIQPKTLIIIVSHSIEISNHRSSQMFNCLRDKKVYIINHRQLLRIKSNIQKDLESLKDLFEIYDVVISNSTNVRRSDREALFELFKNVNIIICWDTRPYWNVEKTKYKDISLISKTLEIDDISNHTISKDGREIKLMRCA